METDRERWLYICRYINLFVRWYVATYQRLYVPTYVPKYIQINIFNHVCISGQTIVFTDGYNYLFSYVTTCIQPDNCLYAYTSQSATKRIYFSLFVTLQKKEKMEKKNPVYVAISTQKGGVGKTSFTVLLASHFYYRSGYNVLVIDCDRPQYSIIEMRDRDSEVVMKNDYYKRMAYNQFRELNKRAYPIVRAKAEEAIEVAEEQIEKSEQPFDLVLFDLPGTVNSAGVLKTIAKMNYLFSPICADKLILTSTLSFLDTLNKELVSRGQTDIKGMYLYWNQVDGREKSELYAIYEKVIGDLGLHLMKTFVPDTKRFRKEMSEGAGKAVFRSTLFPTDRRLMRGSRLEELFDEIKSILEI